MFVCFVFTPYINKLNEKSETEKKEPFTYAVYFTGYKEILSKYNYANRTPSFI